MSNCISSKLPDVGTTIFTVMSQLAADTNAINLAQGFPSFDPPAELLDRVNYYLQHSANQYAPMPGVAQLRSEIAALTRQNQGRTIDVDREVTVCCGATEGLFCSIQALVRADDEVIIFEPAYDAYEPAIRLAGGVARRCPLQISADGQRFCIDWQRLEDLINERTRLLILNFPHNPTGAILKPQDLAQLAGLTEGYDCFLLSDEVYEHIVFDGNRHHSLLSHDALWERSIVVSSFGKSLHATGWKVGYCIAPKYLSDEFRKVHQFATFAISTPMQHAIADFLANGGEFLDGLAGFYQQKRDRFCQLLAGSRFRMQPAEGTFFQLLDYSEISTLADIEVAERWTRDIGVASIPLSVFCTEPFTGQRLRFCFAKDDATLAAAAAKLCQL